MFYFIIYFIIIVTSIMLSYIIIKWLINEHKEWGEMGDLLGQMYLNSTKDNRRE